MGKKVKTGKQRKDRFYQLAKETGYRSRAAFKLIQLNRKFEFLNKSRALVDLCAAPGGWLQVAEKCMPVSSIVIGVDLVPIRNLNNVISLQCDITTPQCRTMLKKELKTWKADVFLNDGAPNVGKNWLFDAYNQIHLTLSALKLASEFLMKGGWFVTKVFRSKDYNALMWLLQKLFKKVHATKPQASRNESAEIFVVCEKYLAPDKIDPKFFDPSFLFDDVKTNNANLDQKQTLLKPVKKGKKSKAEGYEDGDSSVSRKIIDVDFIESQNHIELLSKCNEICLTDEILKFPETTREIIDCCTDIKVLGRKDLISLISWRKKIRAILKKDKPVDEEAEKTNSEEKVSDIEIEPTEESILEKEAKRKRRTILKARKKINDRMNLKMVLKNDELIEEQDTELFQLKNLSRQAIQKLENANSGDVSDDSDNQREPKQKKVLYEKYEKKYNDEASLNSDSGSEYQDDGENDMEFEEDFENDDDNESGSELAEDAGLILNFDKPFDRDQNKLFFDKPIFKNIDDDDFGIDDVTSDDDSDEDESKTESTPLLKEDNKANKIVVPKKLTKLDPEGLALAEEMVTSSKTRRDMIDDSWDRHVRGDHDNLPSWFRKDEEAHNKRLLPISEEKVEEYKQRLREINARPIKKVAEARARKRKRAVKKFERAKKKAENITDDAELTEREKASHMKGLYKKAMKGSTKARNVTYIVSKKSGGTSKPNIKGRYKRVDSRMKKDQNEKGKPGKGSGKQKGKGSKAGGKHSKAGGRGKGNKKSSRK